MNSRHILIGILLATTLACSTSTPTGTPGVTNEGKHKVWYKGPELTAEIYYAWLVRYPGEQYAMVRLGFAGSKGTTEVKRTNIRLQTPDGTVLAPLDQAGFREVYGMLRMAIDRNGAWYGPSTRFMSSRELCDRWFIYPPADTEGFTAQRHAFDSVYVSNFQACGGPLVFPVLQGIQPGRWVLTVELEETTARIPFEVELALENTQ